MLLARCGFPEKNHEWENGIFSLMSDQIHIMVYRLANGREYRRFPECISKRSCSSWEKDLKVKSRL